MSIFWRALTSVTQFLSFQMVPSNKPLDSLNTYRSNIWMNVAHPCSKVSLTFSESMLRSPNGGYSVYSVEYHNLNKWVQRWCGQIIKKKNVLKRLVCKQKMMHKLVEWSSRKSTWCVVRRAIAPSTRTYHSPLPSPPSLSAASASGARWLERRHCPATLQQSHSTVHCHFDLHPPTLFPPVMKSAGKNPRALDNTRIWSQPRYFRSCSARHQNVV